MATPKKIASGAIAALKGFPFAEPVKRDSDVHRPDVKALMRPGKPIMIKGTVKRPRKGSPEDVAARVRAALK